MLIECGSDAGGAAWSEQETEEGADAQGFLEDRRCGRGVAARRGGVSGVADKMPRLPEEYLPGGGAGPNVILVIIDSLRRDHVGAYGNPWIQTPTLDALAAESLLFTHAQPEAMPTLPARRAIYTGMRTWPTSPPPSGGLRSLRAAHAGGDPRARATAPSS